MACRTGRVEENKAGDIIKDVRCTAARSGAASYAVRRLDAASGGRRPTRGGDIAQNRTSDAQRTMKMGTIASP